MFDCAKFLMRLYLEVVCRRQARVYFPLEAGKSKLFTHAIQFPGLGKYFWILEDFLKLVLGGFERLDLICQRKANLMLEPDVRSVWSKIAYQTIPDLDYQKI